MKRGSKRFERYSAKLLFQFRVITNGTSNKRRTCEERIILLKCGSAKDALHEAKKFGRNAQYFYKNDAGGTIHFEFVGVLDLQHLGIECEENEVWYDITEALTPMERRDKLIPPEGKLSAIVWERTSAAQQIAPADAIKRRG